MQRERTALTGAVEEPATAANTIDELERRAAAIDDAEHATMLQLAEHLRELAVALPPESRLPMRLARAARSIDTYTGGNGGLWGCRMVEDVIDEYGREAVEAHVARLQAALDRDRRF